MVGQKTKRLEGSIVHMRFSLPGQAAELEWIRSNPKAQGNKSKARLNRYDELL
jgi:hypothetical protein